MTRRRRSGSPGALLRRRAIAVAAFLAAAAIGGAARADDEDETVRVVIAGPKRDAIAARLEKEVTALGFTPVAAGPLEGCARAAVIDAVANANASAALCSDGDQIGVWTPKNEGQPVELRDVVAAQEKGPHVHEQLATRAAEVMRANIALLEAPPEEPPPPPAPLRSSPPPSTGDWDEFENADRPVPPPFPQRTARFTASAGASTLVSSMPASRGLSLHAALGVHRALAITARVDAPTGSALLEEAAGAEVRVAPGIAGFGAEMPLAGTRSRFIPRFGVGLGVAWLHASRTANPFPNGDGSIAGASATVVAPAGWASAGLSVGVYGPVRLVAEGLVGTAAGRLAVRDRGVVRGHWGTPLGGLALRVEVQLP
ncbi:MAG: hypothetical protein KIT84_07195 [Labilithrix sp.]|nr:hypothetical protein [Labilithrix sp.]MCW5810780.1 hypothetical protein [Labilithrix sp.]